MSSKLKNIRAAIIDLDGTLIDTAHDFRVAINAMREEFGLTPLALDTILGFVGKGSENLVRRVLLNDFSEAETEQKFAEALDTYQRHYERINGEHSALYPDVTAGLQALKDKGLRLACVTNKPVGFAVPLLDKMGLRAFFEVIYGGDSFPRKKPDPMPLLQVCKDFDLPPAQVVAIGDSSNDAQAARAAGCPVLLLPYGYNHGESVQNVESDGIVATLMHAAQLIHS
ncbi:MAG: phosphoglycolate phosphatase [Burkholderiaceae bacterium]|nr:phosphoglycolate phosphatase [Burkholderiaceae bacterium]